MRLTELLDMNIREDRRNHRVSQLVVVTFDLHNESPDAYKPLETALAEDLDLGRTAMPALIDKAKEFKLPSNTFTSLYQKDGDADELRDDFTQEIERILKEQGLTATYFVAVSENWSIGGGSTR